MIRDRTEAKPFGSFISEYPANGDAFLRPGIRGALCYRSITERRACSRFKAAGGRIRDRGRVPGPLIRTHRMSQLPESTTSPPPASPARMPAPPAGPVAVFPAKTMAAETQPAAHAQHLIPQWLHRAELFTRVLARVCIGIFVVCIPWTPMVWDRNPFFLYHPALAAIAAGGAVRGLVSGLGLLNLWLALADAAGRTRERDSTRQAR